MIELPVPWFLATIGALAGCICTLAGIIFHSLNSRITSQSRVISDQAIQMEGMRKDIERLAGGCGVATCLWASRRPVVAVPQRSAPET